MYNESLPVQNLTPSSVKVAQTGLMILKSKNYITLQLLFIFLFFTFHAQGEHDITEAYRITFWFLIIFNLFFPSEHFRRFISEALSLS